MSEHQDDVIEDVSGVLMTGAAAATRAVEAVARRRQGDAQQRVQETREQTEQLQRRYDAQAAAAERFYADTPRRLDELTHASPADAAALWHGAHVWAELEPDRFGGYAEQFNRHLSGLVGTDVREHLSGVDVSRTESREQVESFIDDNGRTGAANPGPYQDSAARERRDAAEDLTRADDPDISDEERRDLQAQAEDEFHQGDVDQDEADRRTTVEADEVDYDSAERRSSTEEALRTAGVSDEAVAARMTSDRLNGQHPHTAASASKKTATKRRPRAKVHSTQKVRDSGLER